MQFRFGCPILVQQLCEHFEGVAAIACSIDGCELVYVLYQVNHDRTWFTDALCPGLLATSSSSETRSPKFVIFFRVVRNIQNRINGHRADADQTHLREIGAKYQ